MKKLSLSVVAILSLVCGLSVWAAAKVVKIQGEKPVMLIEEGAVLMVPEKATSRYYFHVIKGTKFVCTAEEPAELAGVHAKMIEVKMSKMDGETKKIRCYPESHFVIE